MVTLANYDAFREALVNGDPPELLYDRARLRQWRRRPFATQRYVGYNDAYGVDRQQRARRMFRNIVPVTVEAGRDPTENGYDSYVNEADLLDALAGDAVVRVRTQKYYQRQAAAGQPYFRGLSVTIEALNIDGPQDYYVRVLDGAAENCTCPDRLSRNLACKHMRLVNMKMQRPQRRRRREQLPPLTPRRPVRRSARLQGPGSGLGSLRGVRRSRRVRPINLSVLFNNLKVDAL